MGLEAGDYKGKITAENGFGILKVEEKKLFFMLYLDFLSEKYF